MEKTYENSLLLKGRSNCSRFLKGLLWGSIGGFSGTIVMDLALMGSFSVFRLPALTCFLVIGNTFASFFSIQGMAMARAIQIGVVTHYVIGPLIGALFGMSVVRIKCLCVRTIKKCILLAILYVELISQPLLATSPLLLKMTVPVTLLWYGGSFLMHMLAGGVLGAVVTRGLRLDK